MHTSLIKLTNSQKLSCMVIILMIVLVEIVVILSWNFKEDVLKLDRKQLYVELDSKLIEAMPGYLRINPVNNCPCRNGSFVKIKRTDRQIYMVFKANDLGEENFLYNLSHAELHGSSSVPCELFSMFMRGKKQMVISYSLYGTNSFYYEKLKNLSQQIELMYPDWSMRIYHDRSINQSAICELACSEARNVDFCDVSKLHVKLLDDQMFLDASHVHAFIWRYFSLADNFVDVAIFRDLDSFILEREVDSVKTWLKSQQIAHIMKDHPMHHAPIIGGMWGLKPKEDRSLSQRIFMLAIDDRFSKKYNPKKQNPKGGDQDFLSDHVYHLIDYRSLIHDSYNCENYDYSYPWPTRRKGNCFVGSPYNCDQNLYNFFPCPQQCRPKDHLDWTFC